jgi:hypothetical protein
MTEHCNSIEKRSDVIDFVHPTCRKGPSRATISLDSDIRNPKKLKKCLEIITLHHHPSASFSSKSKFNCPRFPAEEVKCMYSNGGDARLLVDGWCSRDGEWKLSEAGLAIGDSGQGVVRFLYRDFRKRTIKIERNGFHTSRSFSQSASLTRLPEVEQSRDTSDEEADEGDLGFDRPHHG